MIQSTTPNQATQASLRPFVRPVLIRAYGDEPIRAIALSVRRGVVRITRSAGATEIDFPSDSVYRFTSRRYSELVKAFTSGKRAALVSLWKATPNGP